LVVTEFGRVIQGYADEIFRLGRELLTAGRRGHASQALRLHLGVVDSFPKLVSLDVLRPLLAQVPPVHVSCREGKIDDLLGQLAAHRLDALLADEPPPSGATVKTFTHELGGSGITFCAAPALARRLRGRFPRNLDGAPMLLPTPNTALRRDLETWFRSVGVSPVVIGEFEDAALAKIVATDGHGVTVVPTVVVADAVERYGYVSLGKTESCRMQLYLITAERRIEHPAVVLLARAAGQGSIGRAGANRSRRGTDSVRD
jgi:LysR family transcriptional activator of nhaA